MSNYILANNDKSTNITLISTITNQHFGANFLATQLPTGSDVSALASFTTALEQVSPRGLRWPGGTVAETVFDMNHEDSPIMNGRATVGQRQFFDIAGSLNADVTITLQTRSAFGADHFAAAALGNGEYGNRQVDPQYLTDLRAYVGRTLADAAATGTHISLFEIGNEFWGGGEMTATEYGRVARAVLTAVNDALNHTTFPVGSSRPVVAIQSLNAAGYMSQSGDSTVYVKDGAVDNQYHVGWTAYTIPDQGTAYFQAMKIADMITGKAEGGANLSHLVGGMIDHYYPKSGLAAIDAETDNFMFRQFDALERRLGFTNGDLSRNVTEWNPIRNVDSNGDGFNDTSACNRGMPQAAMMINMIYEMTTHGVITSDVWPLYFSKASQNNLIGGANYEVRVPGVAFSLMSESLVGTQPLFDSVQTIGKGQFAVHGFSNNQKLVLFVANQSDTASNATTLDLSKIGTPTLQTQLTQSFFITSAIMHSVDSDGLADNGATNPDVRAVTTYTNGIMMTGKVVNEGNLAAWDIVRTEITLINKNANLVEGRDGNDFVNCLAGNDTILGGGGNDSLHGSVGKDSLEGGDGNDQLFGESGLDVLFGGAGADTLIGGASKDISTGGAGADRFVFANSFGPDQITDFNHAEGDRIDFSGMTGTNDVKSFANVQARMHDVSGSAHITFGPDDLVLTGVLASSLTAQDFIY